MRIIQKQFEGGGMPYLEPDCTLLCIDIEQGFANSKEKDEESELTGDDLDNIDGGEWE